MKRKRRLLRPVSTRTRCPHHLASPPQSPPTPHHLLSQTCTCPCSAFYRVPAFEYLRPTHLRSLGSTLHHLSHLLFKSDRSPFVRTIKRRTASRPSRLDATLCAILPFSLRAPSLFSSPLAIQSSNFAHVRCFGRPLTFQEPARPLLSHRSLLPFRFLFSSFSSHRCAPARAPGAVYSLRASRRRPWCLGAKKGVDKKKTERPGGVRAVIPKARKKEKRAKESVVALRWSQHCRCAMRGRSIDARDCAAFKVGVARAQENERQRQRSVR